MKLVSAHHKFPGSSLHFLSHRRYVHLHLFTHTETCQVCCKYASPSAASWHFTKFPADEGIDLWRPTCEAKSPGFMDQRNTFNNSYGKAVEWNHHCFTGLSWQPNRPDAGCIKRRFHGNFFGEHRLSSVNLFVFISWLEYLWMAIRVPNCPSHFLCPGVVKDC